MSIAEAVMVAMVEQGIVVLPIHDSFLVDYRREGTLREEIMRACRDHIGIEIEADPSMIDDLVTTPGETVDQFAVDKRTQPLQALLDFEEPRLPTHGPNLPQPRQEITPQP